MSPAGASNSPPQVQLPSVLPAPRQIKLYNSGSFFDPGAIPPEDYPAIAERLRPFERAIVECHPALVGRSALTFRDLLSGTCAGASAPRSPSKIGLRGGTALAAAVSPKRERNVTGAQPLSSAPVGHCSTDASPGCLATKLEVAMGLETAHPGVLDKLNKRMTLDLFRRAAEYLRSNDIALRVFVLGKPPFLDEAGALEWAGRSVDFAFDCGATAVSLIPTRLGNGALEALAACGEFSPPKLSTLEAVLDYGIGLKRGRVFVDLWDLEKFANCPACFERRRARLDEMNLEQVVRPPVDCECYQMRDAGKPR